MYEMKRILIFSGYVETFINNRFAQKMMMIVQTVIMETSREKKAIEICLEMKFDS
jgi:hypothetical protein